MKHLAVPVLLAGALFMLAACAQDEASPVNEALTVSLTLENGATLERTYHGTPAQLSQALQALRVRSEQINTMLEEFAVESGSFTLHGAELTVQTPAGDPVELPLYLPDMAQGDEAYTLNGLHDDFARALANEGFVDADRPIDQDVAVAQQASLPDECARILLWVHCSWQSADGSGTNGCECTYGLRAHCYGNCSWR